MSKNAFLLLAALALLPGGCTLAPKYQRPAAPVPAQWPAGPAYTPGATTNAALGTDMSWQQFFPDQHLQRVIGLALTNNLNLRTAALNVERARALYGIARAELLPVVDGTATAIRQRVPADLSGTGKAQTASQYSVGLGVASWEIDFFGRIRSLKEEALQQYFATEEARRSVQILLISSVANAYLALVSDRENLHIAETTLQTQQAAYDLVKRRHTLGLAPELDVFQAQTPVDTARRQVATYTQQVAKDENALNLLVGARGAADWSGLPTELSGITAPKAIGAGVSSEVLLRRPDVLQAEDQLKAANADIGAARAAFFPRISLTAAFGTASSDLSGLFKSGSFTWSYAPQIVLPVFDARTWSAHRASKVQRDLAVSQYENAIQSAFKDVADALAVRGTVDHQVAAQESLVHASAETYRLATSRYEKGIDNFLTVLDAQRSLFAAQQVLVALRQEQLASHVNLYAVLGGGWDAQPSATVAAASAKPAPPRN
jgi:outer membrane protein, multidrug efflux system